MPNTQTAKILVNIDQKNLPHGLTGKQFCLTPDESVSSYEEFAKKLLQSIDPRDDLELYLANKLIQSAWKLQRANKLEANFFKERMTSAETDDPHLAIKYDFDNVFSRVNRYEFGLSRSFHAALRDLMRLRYLRQQKDENQQ